MQHQAVNPGGVRGGRDQAQQGIEALPVSLEFLDRRADLPLVEAGFVLDVGEVLGDEAVFAPVRTAPLELKSKQDA